MVWILLAAGAWASLTYFWTVPDTTAEATSIIARMHPRGSWRDRLETWLRYSRHQWPGYGDQARMELEVLQLTPLRYGQEMALFAGGSALILGIDGAAWLAPVGFVVGLLSGRLYLRWRYERWLKLCTAQVGELVTLLKARMQAGDTVVRAMQAVAPQIMDPLATQWRRALDALASGQPLHEVVGDLRRRLPDRDISAVLSQIVIYDRDSIPDDPFGTLANHLARMKLLRREYAVKSATGSLTLFEGLAFFGALLAIGLPIGFVWWTHAVSNGIL